MRSWGICVCLFLRVDGAMELLVKILTGNDPEQQLGAVWCLTNIAAGTDEHAEMVLKYAGSYLTTFLSGGNAALQVSVAVQGLINDTLTYGKMKTDLNFCEEVKSDFVQN